MSEIKHIYDAIEEFKKFPTPEQKQLATKFLNYYAGPNQKFIEREFDWEDFKQGNLGDDGLEELVDFLQGEDPFYMSDPPQNIWHEIMNSFNEFLFEELPELQALKKGYEEPIRLDMSEQEILEVAMSLTRYKHKVSLLEKKLLPELHKIVQNDSGDTPLAYNELSRIFNNLISSIEGAVVELKWFWKTQNEKITGDSRASMRDIQGRQKRIIAHMKQYSKNVVQMTKEQTNFLKQMNVFKTRLPEHLKRELLDKSLSQENINGLKKLETFVMDDLSDIVGHNIPFLGAYKTYKTGDEGMSAVILGIDVYFLSQAIILGSAAMASGPIAVAMAIGAMFVADVMVGTALMGVMQGVASKWDDAIEFYAPQLSNKHKRLDYLEQRGAKSD